MPELRHLRVFVVVGEELNFTRAAERLFLSQQAVSKSVGQLERELGVPLLERSTHAVALTPAGAALLDPCRAALGAIDAALADARAVGRSERGTVRVGVTPAVGAAVRRDILRVLRDGAPELAISVREVRPGEIGALLRDRLGHRLLAEVELLRRPREVQLLGDRDERPQASQLRDGAPPMAAVVKSRRTRVSTHPSPRGSSHGFSSNDES